MTVIRELIARRPIAPDLIRRQGQLVDSLSRQQLQGKITIDEYMTRARRYESTPSEQMLAIARVGGTVPPLRKILHIKRFIHPRESRRLPPALQSQNQQITANPVDLLVYEALAPEDRNQDVIAETIFSSPLPNRIKTVFHAFTSFVSRKRG